MLEEWSGGGGGSWSPTGSGGGALDLLPNVRAAKTHPTIVPEKSNIWTFAKRKVIKCMPINLGSFLRQRTVRLSTVFIEELSEGIDDGGEASLGRSDDGTGRGRSAGCRAGKVSWSTG